MITKQNKDKMRLSNKKLDFSRKTIETRMVNAILVGDNKKIETLIRECEYLFTEEYLNDNEFNYLTDTESLKDMLS